MKKLVLKAFKDDFTCSFITNFENLDLKYF